jgi:hypothetical protein
MAIQENYTTNTGAAGNYWCIDKQSVSKGLDLFNKTIIFNVCLFTDEAGKKNNGYDPLTVGYIQYEDPDFPLETIKDGETETDMFTLFMDYLYDKIHEAPAFGTVTLRDGIQVDISGGTPLV